MRAHTDAYTCIHATHERDMHTMPVHASYQGASSGRINDTKIKYDQIK